MKGDIVCGSCCQIMDDNGIDCPTCEDQVREELTGRNMVRKGTTRTVFLIGKYAIKVPSMGYGWANFLRGLLANMQEVELSGTGDARLAPITFHVRGGWLLVMPRCRPITPREFAGLDLGRFDAAEEKRDSFGWYEGQIVVVDYGG